LSAVVRFPHAAPDVVVTAHSIPAELERRDGYLGEWDVWDRLRRELPDGTTLLYGVKLPQGPSGRQIDTVSPPTPECRRTPKPPTRPGRTPGCHRPSCPRR
jgi:hypothetical protein